MTKTPRWNTIRVRESTCREMEKAPNHGEARKQGIGSITQFATSAITRHLKELESDRMSRVSTHEDCVKIMGNGLEKIGRIVAVCFRKGEGTWCEYCDGADCICLTTRSRRLAAAGMLAVSIMVMAFLERMGAEWSHVSSSNPPSITILSDGYPSENVPEQFRGAADPNAPIGPVPVDGTFDFPLVINENGYALGGHTSTIVPQEVAAGETASIMITIYDPLDVTYFATYLNLPDDEISHLESDVQVIYDAGKVRVVDPEGILSGVSVSIQADPGDPTKKIASVTVTFAEEIGDTNMVVRTWNADSQITTISVLDALRVAGPSAGLSLEASVVDPEPGVDPEPAEVIAPESIVVDQEPTLDALTAIRMWAGYDPTVATDANLLDALNLDYPGADIPGWVMTELGPLAAKGEITVGEFTAALVWVLDNG